MKNLERLIEIKSRQLDLLKEIKRNARLQEKEYYITRVDRRNFQLVKTEGNELVKYDTLSRINSFLNLRGLQDKVIYDNGIFQNTRRDD